jgi:hypothetical protein
MSLKVSNVDTLAIGSGVCNALDLTNVNRHRVAGRPIHGRLRVCRKKPLTVNVPEMTGDYVLSTIQVHQNLRPTRLVLSSRIGKES